MFVFVLIFLEIFTFSCLQSLTLIFSLGTNSQKGMFWYDTPNVSWLRPSYEMVRQPTLDGFDLTKYQGRWYEVAFHDYTQYSEVSWPIFPPWPHGEPTYLRQLLPDFKRLIFDIGVCCTCVSLAMGMFLFFIPRCV